MGKADYRKVNDCRDNTGENRDRLDSFYKNEKEAPTGRPGKRKKATKRSDHKHQYKKVIFREKSRMREYNYYFGRYCSICGKKIQDTFSLVKENEDSNVYVILTKDIIDERYSDFPIMDI